MSDKNPEISLADIFAILSKHRALLLGCVSAATFVALLYAIFATPLYTASVVVQPASVQGGEGALSALTAQLGPAAALAGISLGSDASKKNEHLAILKSRQFAARFMQTSGVLPHLFRSRWNAESKTWQRPRRTLLRQARGAISKLLANLSGDEGWKERPASPSESEAYERFLQIVEVDEDVKTGLMTVSFTYQNPQLAARWANEFVALANKQIQETTVREANRALEYLNHEVESTSVTDLRNTMYSLIQRQLEQIALANAREEYAFRTIDRATVPELRSQPRRAMVVIIGIAVGLALGGALALFIELMRQPKSRG